MELRRLYFQHGDIHLAAVHRTGSGIPLLFLHGLAGSTDEWDELVAELKPDDSIVALDLRGHGHSGRNPASLDPCEFVEDCKFVLQKLNIEQVIVVGQSMGGIVATHLAHKAPKMVSALVLIDAGMSGFDADHDFSALEKWLDSQDVNTEVMLASLTALGERHRWSEWEQLDLPTLVCFAEKSILTMVEREKMQRIRPECEYQIVEGAGHDIHLDAPEILARLLTKFVKQTSKNIL